MLRALINKGTVLAKLGKYYKALRELSRAIELDQSSYKAWYNKTLVHFLLEQ